LKKSVVLIVEDDAALRQVFRAALAIAGYDVHEVGDGYLALAFVEQHTPDLIVLDLGLPRLDGVSVRQEIAAHPTTELVPVVVVTGDRSDLSRLDVACVLRKPVCPDDLVSTVNRYLPSTRLNSRA
jgi:CheY-like chemotaxis protein